MDTTTTTNRLSPAMMAARAADWEQQALDDLAALELQMRNHWRGRLAGDTVADLRDRIKANGGTPAVSSSATKADLVDAIVKAAVAGDTLVKAARETSVNAWSLVRTVGLLLDRVKAGVPEIEPRSSWGRAQDLMDAAIAQAEADHIAEYDAQLFGAMRHRCVDQHPSHWAAIAAEARQSIVWQAVSNYGGARSTSPSSNPIEAARMTALSRWVDDYDLWLFTPVAV